MYPYKILVICLAAQYIITALIYYKKTKNIFNPATIVSIMYMIKSIPHLWIICNSLNNLDYRVYSHSSWPGLNISIVRYIILGSISHLALLIGINIHLKFKDKRKGLVFRMEENQYQLEKAGWITFFLGVICFFIVIRNIGGISFLLNNLSKRAHLLKGEGYIFTIMQASITLSVCLSTYNLKNNKSNAFKGRFLLILVGSLIILSCFGGRTPSINLIINIILILNFTNPKFKLISIKNVILCIFIWGYILVMPMLRTEDSISIYTKNPSLLFSQVSKDIFEIIEEISIVDENMFVFNQFNSRNYWYGSSYFDLIKAPIPSKIFPNKPPVDDGMYIWNLLIGNDVKPSTPVNQMHNSSWPLNTTGMMYANFGIIGIVIGMVIMGYIYSYTYYLVVRSNKCIFALTLYFYILFRFEISNLYIVQALSPIIINLIICTILLKLKVRKIKYN